MALSPQPPGTPVEDVEASAPAGSDTELRSAAVLLSAGHDTSRPITPPPPPLADAERPGVGAMQTGRDSLAWHGDALWRASVHLPQLVVRNGPGGAWETNDAAASAGPHAAPEGVDGPQDCAEWDAERQFTAMRRRRANGEARGGRRRASAPPLQRHRRPSHGTHACE